MYINKADRCLWRKGWINIDTGEKYSEENIEMGDLFPCIHGVGFDTHSVFSQQAC